MFYFFPRSSTKWLDYFLYFVIWDSYNLNFWFFMICYCCWCYKKENLKYSKVFQINLAIYWNLLCKIVLVRMFLVNMSFCFYKSMYTYVIDVLRFYQNLGFPTDSIQSQCRIVTWKNEFDFVIVNINTNCVINSSLGQPIDFLS